ncbi:unannotated protein [freshwater metagenome]|uniref:Unannotated protein n=1 Tax=freshwater metagenome TaxID=449393 RepID=A0A6J7CY89_9ZZZZ|nr:hypothetical protein [Actinomycetota bacterium]
MGGGAAIVEREELLPTAFELSARIAALPPEAVQTARAIFRRGEHEAVLPGYRSELDAIIDLG